jgi:hypothetical protein
MSTFRSFLYAFARFLGDVSAVQHHRIGKRIRNRIVGRATGRMIGRILR